MTFELDIERKLGVWDFPRIAVLQPFIGLLNLITIFDVLLEDAEIVAQSIADPGQVQGGDRIQKTCCEPAEAAIAEASIDLVFPQVLPIEPLLKHGRAADLLHLKIDDIVAHQAPDQELERQVVDPFHISLVMRLLSRDPSFDKLIPDCKRKRIIAVPVCCAVAILGKRAAKMTLEILPETRGRHFFVPVVGGRGAADLEYCHFDPQISGSPSRLRMRHRVIFAAGTRKLSVVIRRSRKC